MNKLQEITILMKLKINYTQKEKVDTLGQLMDDISRKAIARGLTPEILVGWAMPTLRLLTKIAALFTKTPSRNDSL